MNRKLLIAIGVALLAGGAGLAVALAAPGSHDKDSRDHGGGAAAAVAASGAAVAAAGSRRRRKKNGEAKNG